MRQDDQAEGAAQIAAERWLALIDARKYPEAWEQAATLLKSQASRDVFAEDVRQARETLGAFASRALSSRSYTTHVPGAPDGEYVVVRMHARFADSLETFETITVCKGSDGVWRVGGYFVR
jgi:hypothetical protein